MSRIGIGLLLLLWALPASPIGYVYTGVGGGGRELLDLTVVDVQVQIDERVAVTRVDQIFSNRSDQVLEGIYEFALPAGAIITDLVLWIDGRRVQGQVLEKNEARRTYDAIVGRRIDPALLEQIDAEHFRLSIFPFPANGSRRVELEYTQVLAARSGRMDYRFPLKPETDQELVMGRFSFGARVRGQRAFDVAIDGAFAAAGDISRDGDTGASVFFADEDVLAERDFGLRVVERSQERLPTVLSYAPQSGELGYYALWLPPLDELTDAEPLPRSITFVIDVSSSMRGDKMTAVKGALASAIAALDAEDLFNVVVFSNSATAFEVGPVAANAANKEAAISFVRQHGALGSTNFEAAIELALGQQFPSGRANHMLFLTDGRATLGATNLGFLGRRVEELAAGAVRIFTIGVGSDIDSGFLRALAADHLGEYRSLSDAGDIEEHLRQLFVDFTRPIFLPTRLTASGVEAHEVYPAGVDLLAAGQEFFQVGRYPRGGALMLRLEGLMQGRELVLEYPLDFTAADTAQSIVPRLWAHQKVQALEGQIARFGAQGELLDDILDLGLQYRLVTRRTSLFAPDDGVVINPEPEIQDFGGGATAVEEEASVLSLLGVDFELRGDIYYDLKYDHSIPISEYIPGSGQPARLADFARLDRDLVVVIDRRAYSVRRGILPASPILAQNVPNPFNPHTQIRFVLPFAAEAELVVYNLAGQRIRELARGYLVSGGHEVAWDGRDASGKLVASGVYIYRLHSAEGVSSKRMLLLR